MRGCNNMCAYCVVPFTRGRERSHPFSAVIGEVRKLAASGYREITLLGQNVNSYLDPEQGRNFAALLDAVSREAPRARIRFYHLPPERYLRGACAYHCRSSECLQSYSSSGAVRFIRILERMNRGHTIEEYREKIALIRSVIPDVTLSTDIIAGFCGEEEEDHLASLELLADIRFDLAYMFFYSTRPGTLAERTLADDVPEAVKKRRLQEIIDLQNSISAELFQQAIGSVVEVLAESESKRSAEQLMGRTAGNRAVVFDREGHQPGDLVHVLVTAATSATLNGRPE